MGVLDFSGAVGPAAWEAGWLGPVDKIDLPVGFMKKNVIRKCDQNK